MPSRAWVLASAAVVACSAPSGVERATPVEEERVTRKPAPVSGDQAAADQAAADQAAADQAAADQAAADQAAADQAAAPAPKPASAADYDRHIVALRAKLAAAGQDGLNILVEEPFVVVGNDPPDVLARRARTVRWAADALERDFFTRRPTRILDVYLWNDRKSYERGVRALTGEAPGTPYGFYASAHDGLFMNIATGGGTLVHELVHPYVEADFPGAPAWLNEGLGSLFEQSSHRDGHIVGHTNWRLEGLQEAIRGGGLPSFRALTKMSDHAFYQQDRGTNYAQARYLLYYLQEQDLLIDFYRAFRADRAADPTGFDTLAKALGEPDLKAFQRRWEAYVLTLVFDG